MESSISVTMQRMLCSPKALCARLRVRRQLLELQQQCLHQREREREREPRVISSAPPVDSLTKTTPNTQWGAKNPRLLPGVQVPRSCPHHFTINDFVRYTVALCRDRTDNACT
eukprot:2234628-Amphidinium_carterae.1